MLFLFAFVAAPHSCEWGLSAYFWVGLVAVLGLAATPFAVRPKLSSGSLVLRSLGHSSVGICTWFAGLFVANFRIICRLI